MPQLPPNLSYLQPFLDEYDTQQNRANQANEGRYRQLIGMARRGGFQERQQIKRDYGEARAEGQQSLINRGLFNTTVLDAMNKRNLESQTVAMNQSRQNQRDRVMGVIERRTDQQPNLGLLSSLLQTAAQGSGQLAGQGGAGAGRSFNFGGVNPTRFSQGGGSELFGGGAGGSGGGGGVNFGEGGTGGGGGGGGGGVTTTRNTGIGFDATQRRYIPGMGYMTVDALRNIYNNQPARSTSTGSYGFVRGG